MVEIMRQADFQAPFPGRLVPVHFDEGDAAGLARQEGVAFVPNPLPPEPVDRQRLVSHLFDVLDRAKSNLLRLESAVDRLPNPAVLLGAMRTREVQASSKIENTVASLREIALAEFQPSSAAVEAVEVRRNRHAILAGLDSKLPISVRLLCEMHRVLVVDRRHRPGRLRDRQVYIGDESRGFKEARFVPPPADAIDTCMRDWELFSNPDAREAPQRERYPELIELAWSHYQFEAIHPFSDGNGRLGRALVNLAPVKSGMLKHPVCNLSEWVHAHRQEYYDRLLRVSTHGEWEGWTRFFCTALAEQAQLDLQRAERVTKLHATYMELVQTKRQSALLPRLIDHLFVSHAVTISGAAEVLGVSYTAAQRHVERLASMNVLKQAGKGNYGRVYVAEGVLRAIRGKGGD